MKFKKIIAVSLIIIFLTITAAAAAENTTPPETDENSDLELISETEDSENISVQDNDFEISDDNTDNVAQLWKVRLISENVTMYYDETTAEIEVIALDVTNFTKIGGLKVLLNDKITPEYFENNAYHFYIDDLPVGKHVFKISIEDEKYTADPVEVSVNVLKSKPTVTAKKYYTTTDQYVRLRAEIEDEDRDAWIDEGTVTFKIRGKTYTVKVDGGDAIKKIKIRKPGIYTFTATFKSKNHYTTTVKQKVYVYGMSKKARTFKIKGYKVVIPKSKYKKFVNAKNTNKIYGFTLKTKKSVKQTYVTYKKTTKWKLYKRNVYPLSYYYENSNYKVKNLKKIWIDKGAYDLRADIYKKVTKTKKVYKTVKTRVFIDFAYGGKNGCQGAPAKTYTIHLGTKYQNPGYDITSGWVIGWKKSTQLNTLKKAKTKW